MGIAMVCQATDPPQVMAHRAIRCFVVLTMPIELFLLLLALTLLQGFGVILNVPKRTWINQYLSWICCLAMRMMSIMCNSVVALGAISGCLNFERKKEPRGNIGLLNFERKIRLKNEGIFTEQEFLNFGIFSFKESAIEDFEAMGRAATSLSKLADTAREELPSTMATIRLSGMEISDLTLERSDLSQEIADGVSKSTQAVQAAEAGIRQIGAVARQQTISMIQERASLPIISLQPVVAGAAKKTSHAVG
ncbi:uncharacterized protein LOC126712751 [Quercus robur]|uniref:uncharacterized protein LOC126712751 n=1 Tax=Quercus robur TaxID=38942 RepID=UPI002161C552|nr:uncharacterized protein LOC126712751 [Quercus robur]